MRFTSSFKFVLGLLAAFAVIFFAIFYGYNHLNDQTLKFIEDYAGAVFIIVIFVSFPPKTNGTTSSMIIGSWIF